MALVITYKTGPDPIHLQDITDHLPFALSNPTNTRMVVEATADGDELQYIHKHFSSNNLGHPNDWVPTIPLPFPLTGHSVVTWYGDMAKFIVANLS